MEGLVKRGDARLLAAYDVYVDSQDVDDLVDTILRVARRDAGLDAQDARPPQDFASVSSVWKSNCRCASQGLHAIDATPARPVWRSIQSSGRAVQLTHWLISAQARSRRA